MPLYKMFFYIPYYSWHMMNNLYFMFYICAVDNDCTNFSLTSFCLLIFKWILKSPVFVSVSWSLFPLSLCFPVSVSVSLSFVHASTHTHTHAQTCMHTHTHWSKPSVENCFPRKISDPASARLSLQCDVLQLFPGTFQLQALGYVASCVISHRHQKRNYSLLERDAKPLI